LSSQAPTRMMIMLVLSRPSGGMGFMKRRRGLRRISGWAEVPSGFARRLVCGCVCLECRRISGSGWPGTADQQFSSMRILGSCFGLRLSIQVHLAVEGLIRRSNSGVLNAKAIDRRDRWLGPDARGASLSGHLQRRRSPAHLAMTEMPGAGQSPTRPATRRARTRLSSGCPRRSAPSPSRRLPVALLRPGIPGASTTATSALQAPSTQRKRQPVRTLTASQ
jgi:hypothetical protein